MKPTRKSFVFALFIFISLGVLAPTAAPSVASAETEPPFFPVVTFDKTVSLPASEFVITVDLAAPSAARAKEYRSTWNGETTKWLPLTREIRYPIPLDKKSVRRNYFAVQFRDALMKQSAPYRNSMEVLPFVYLQTAIPVSASGPGCTDAPYGHTYLERSYQLTLPTNLRFQVRYLLCKENFTGLGSCSTVTLKDKPWQDFDRTKPIVINEEIFPYMYCSSTRVVLQTRDEMGFETPPFYLPK